MSRILGIGGTAYDMLAVIPHMPAWEEVEYIEEYEVQQGGMVATGIVAASRLGAKTEYIGALGDDPEAQFHIENFTRHNVLQEKVITYPGESSAITVVLVHAGTGRRSFIHYKGVNAKPRLDLQEFDFSEVSHLLLDGFFFDTAMEAAREARRLNITTVTDMSPRTRNPNLPEYLNLIDYPVLSELFLCPYTNIQNPLEAGKSIIQQGNKSLIVTCGEKGSYIITHEGTEHLPTYPIQMVDSTGAGDVFHGGFIFALWKGYSVSDSVRFASACAALNCTRIGGQKGIPDYIEVCNFLLQQNPGNKSWIKPA